MREPSTSPSPTQGVKRKMPWRRVAGLIPLLSLIFLPTTLSNPLHIPQTIRCPNENIYVYVNETEADRSRYIFIEYKAPSLHDCIWKCFGNQFCYSIRYDESKADPCSLFYFSAYNCTHQTLTRAEEIQYKGSPITIDCLRCPNNGEFITAPPIDYISDQRLDAKHNLTNRLLPPPPYDESEDTAPIVHVHKPSEATESTNPADLETTTALPEAETVTSDIVAIGTSQPTVIQGEFSTSTEIPANATESLESTTTTGIESTSESIENIQGSTKIPEETSQSTNDTETDQTATSEEPTTIESIVKSEASTLGLEATSTTEGGAVIAGATIAVTESPSSTENPQSPSPSTGVQETSTAQSNDESSISLDVQPRNCDGEVQFLASTSVDLETVQLLINSTIAESAPACARECYKYRCGFAYYNPETKLCEFTSNTKDLIEDTTCEDLKEVNYKAFFEKPAAVQISCVSCRPRDNTTEEKPEAVERKEGSLQAGKGQSGDKEKKACVIRFQVDEQADTEHFEVAGKKNVNSINECAALCYGGSGYQAVYSPTTNECRFGTAKKESCSAGLDWLSVVTPNKDVLLQCFRCTPEKELFVQQQSATQEAPTEKPPLVGDEEQRFPTTKQPSSEGSNWPGEQPTVVEGSAETAPEAIETSSVTSEEATTLAAEEATTTLSGAIKTLTSLPSEATIIVAEGSAETEHEATETSSVTTEATTVQATETSTLLTTEEVTTSEPAIKSTVPVLGSEDATVAHELAEGSGVEEGNTTTAQESATPSVADVDKVEGVHSLTGTNKTEESVEGSGLEATTGETLTSEEATTALTKEASSESTGVPEATTVLSSETTSSGLPDTTSTEATTAVNGPEVLSTTVAPGLDNQTEPTENITSTAKDLSQFAADLVNAGLNHISSLFSTTPEPSLNETVIEHHDLEGSGTESSSPSTESTATSVEPVETSSSTSPATNQEESTLTPITSSAETTAEPSTSETSASTSATVTEEEESTLTPTTTNEAVEAVTGEPKGCLVKFQAEPLANRPTDFKSSFAQHFNMETAEDCAKKCYLAGCTATLYNLETKDCALGFGDHPYCSDVPKIEKLLASKESTLWIHCVSCVPGSEADALLAAVVATTEGAGVTEGSGSESSTAQSTKSASQLDMEDDTERFTMTSEPIATSKAEEQESTTETAINPTVTGSEATATEASSTIASTGTEAESLATTSSGTVPANLTEAEPTSEISSQATEPVTVESSGLEVTTEGSTELKTLQGDEQAATTVESSGIEATTEKSSEAETVQAENPEATTGDSLLPGESNENETTTQGAETVQSIQQGDQATTKNDTVETTTATLTEAETIHTQEATTDVESSGQEDVTGRSGEPETNITEAGTTQQAGATTAAVEDVTEAVTVIPLVLESQKPVEEVTTIESSGLETSPEQLSEATTAPAESSDASNTTEAESTPEPSIVVITAQTLQVETTTALPQENETTVESSGAEATTEGLAETTTASAESGDASKTTAETTSSTEPTIVVITAKTIEVEATSAEPTSEATEPSTTILASVDEKVNKQPLDVEGSGETSTTESIAETSSSTTQEEITEAPLLSTEAQSETTALAETTTTAEEVTTAEGSGDDAATKLLDKVQNETTKTFKDLAEGMLGAMAATAEKFVKDLLNENATEPTVTEKGTTEQGEEELLTPQSETVESTTIVQEQNEASASTEKASPTEVEGSGATESSSTKELPETVSSTAEPSTSSETTEQPTTVQAMVVAVSEEATSEAPTTKVSPTVESTTAEVEGSGESAATTTSPTVESTTTEAAFTSTTTEVEGSGEVAADKIEHVPVESSTVQETSAATVNVVDVGSTTSPATAAPSTEHPIEDVEGSGAVTEATMSTNETLLATSPTVENIEKVTTTNEPAKEVATTSQPEATTVTEELLSSSSISEVENANATTLLPVIEGSGLNFEASHDIQAATVEPPNVAEETQNFLNKDGEETTEKNETVAATTVSSEGTETSTGTSTTAKTPIVVIVPVVVESKSTTEAPTTINSAESTTVLVEEGNGNEPNTTVVEEQALLLTTVASNTEGQPTTTASESSSLETETTTAENQEHATEPAFVTDSGEANATTTLPPFVGDMVNLHPLAKDENETSTVPEATTETAATTVVEVEKTLNETSIAVEATTKSIATTTGEVETSSVPETTTESAGATSTVEVAKTSIETIVEGSGQDLESTTAAEPRSPILLTESGEANETTTLGPFSGDLVNAHAMTKTDATSAPETTTESVATTTVEVEKTLNETSSVLETATESATSETSSLSETTTESVVSSTTVEVEKTSNETIVEGSGTGFESTTSASEPSSTVIEEEALLLTTVASNTEGQPTTVLAESSTFENQTSPAESSEKTSEPAFVTDSGESNETTTLPPFVGDLVNVHPLTGTDNETTAVPETTTESLASTTIVEVKTSNETIAFEGSGEASETTTSADQSSTTETVPAAVTESEEANATTTLGPSVNIHPLTDTATETSPASETTTESMASTTIEVVKTSNETTIVEGSGESSEPTTLGEPGSAVTQSAEANETTTLSPFSGDLVNLHPLTGAENETSTVIEASTTSAATTTIEAEKTLFETSSASESTTESPATTTTIEVEKSSNETMVEGSGATLESQKSTTSEPNSTVDEEEAFLWTTVASNTEGQATTVLAESPSSETQNWPAESPEKSSETAFVTDSGEASETTTLPPFVGDLVNLHPLTKDGNETTSVAETTTESPVSNTADAEKSLNETSLVSETTTVPVVSTTVEVEKTLNETSSVLETATDSAETSSLSETTTEPVASTTVTEEKTSNETIVEGSGEDFEFTTLADQSSSTTATVNESEANETTTLSAFSADLVDAHPLTQAENESTPVPTTTESVLSSTTLTVEEKNVTSLVSESTTLNPIAEATMETTLSTDETVLETSGETQETTEAATTIEPLVNGSTIRPASVGFVEKTDHTVKEHKDSGDYDDEKEDNYEDLVEKENVTSSTTTTTTTEPPVQAVSDIIETLVDGALDVLFGKPKPTTQTAQDLIHKGRGFGFGLNQEPIARKLDKKEDCPPGNVQFAASELTDLTTHFEKDAVAYSVQHCAHLCLSLGCKMAAFTRFPRPVCLMHFESTEPCSEPVERTTVYQFTRLQEVVKLSCMKCTRNHSATFKQREQVDITNIGGLIVQELAPSPTQEGTTPACGGRLEFQTLPVASLPRLNITNDVPARTPADCAKKCFEADNCTTAGFIPSPSGDISNGVCLLTSDVKFCANADDFIPQHASLTPFVISCIRCTACTYNIKTVTPDRVLPKFTSFETVKSVGQCAEECFKKKCTMAQYDSNMQICSLSSAPRDSYLCTREVAVLTQGILPVTLECVQCENL